MGADESHRHPAGGYGGAIGSNREAGEQVTTVEINGMNAEVLFHPFRHVVIDGAWDDSLLRAVRAEFPDEADPQWIRYADDDHEEKLEGPASMFGEATTCFIEALEASGPDIRRAFDMPPLVLSTEGGGYHQTNPGGGLAVHADFNRSEDGLYRRVNVITYLNADDEPPNGGELELWDNEGPVTSVTPRFNRTLVFETHDTSFHGHPRALDGPHPRRSFAAYFFSEEAPPHYSGAHTTVWHPRGHRHRPGS